MADALHVWRDGRVHALLTERNGRLSLTYSADARPISTSLPVRSSVHRDAAVRPWFTVSLLFDEHDRVVVAPIYDAMSTRLYETTATGEPDDAHARHADRR